MAQNINLLLDRDHKKQSEHSIEEIKAELEAVRTELEAAKLKLKEYDVSTSGANILEIGYEDGRHGRQPRMSHFLNYRLQWEQGFKDYMASGEFWRDVQDKIMTPF